ncbi:hypothetical protein [uncultured Bradyrhizobium sp.]|uniref:hypothetical protein n=1 Tax=uncultured Bradyrhizobium sp. TaxID=199684 RepID=UPI002605A842|nr:hypothetical protein [uncultured Bradyrhizobium sp.]
MARPLWQSLLSSEPELVIDQIKQPERQQAGDKQADHSLRGSGILVLESGNRKNRRVIAIIHFMGNRPTRWCLDSNRARGLQSNSD